MISVAEYFHDSVTNYGFTPTLEDGTRAEDLLAKVNRLYPACELRSGHRTFEKVKKLISEGYKAALDSQHMHSRAVDIADNDNAKDDALNDAILEEYELYREAPAATSGWLHLQSIAPQSGARTFFP
jgi:hypothetical protein